MCGLLPRLRGALCCWLIFNVAALSLLELLLDASTLPPLPERHGFAAGRIENGVEGAYDGGRGRENTIKRIEDKKHEYVVCCHSYEERRAVG